MLSTADILQATGGVLLTPPREHVFTAVGTDSRTLGRGALFVALSGERFDGHDFLDQAVERGAAGLLVGQAHPAARSVASAKAAAISVIAVADTLRALQDVAAFYRRGMDIPVCAVTGTNGKTTTKEMLHAVLAVGRRTYRSPGNLNNHIGVPLSLLGMPRDTEAAVLEFGMSGAGEIRRLAEIARPTVAVITNVSEAHLTTLKSVDAVARAKGEILEKLPQTGWAVLNRDDHRVWGLRRGVRARVVSFGLTQGCDITADEIAFEKSGGAVFRLLSAGPPVRVRLQRPGRHEVFNALAAAAAAQALGVPPAEMASGLAACELPGMRWELRTLPSGAQLINDAYNANPASVKASMETVAGLGPGRRNIAVLGDMLELGESSEALHREVGRAAAAGAFSLLVTVGERSRWTAAEAVTAGMNRAAVISCDTWEQAAAVLAEQMQPRDRILVKASRGMGLERIADALQKQG